MLLERTIFQLDIGHVPPERARELAHLGYAQWLGALPGDASYPREAMRAFALAHPFAETSPAVAVFCDLLVASVQAEPRPLTLTLAEPGRRGGARARRMSL